MSTPISIYTDGSCTGNPGPGGFGALVYDPDGNETLIAGGEPESTNNKMELSAVIEALRFVSVNPELRQHRITVYTDSQYITKAYSQNWFRNWESNGWRTSQGKPVQNQDLWKALLVLTRELRPSWQWVKGHSGHPQNERCDRIASKMAATAPSRSAYWCSTSGQNGEDETTPAAEPQAQEMPEPEQAPAETPTPADPGTQALVKLAGLADLLAQCHDYETFRERASLLLAPNCS